VLLEPAVVSVLGTNVRVRIEPSVADGQAQVAAGVAPPAGYFLGRGRADDLTAYAQGPAVTRVVGLTRSRQLEVRDGPGSMPAAAGVPAGTPGRVAPTTLDVWQQQVSGPRARELSWRPTPGARSVLVAREDGSPLPAMNVEAAWTNHTWLWIPTAALVLGLLLIVAGLVLGDALPSPAMLARPRGRGPRNGAASGDAEPVGGDVPALAVPSTTAETASVVPERTVVPEPTSAIADPSPTVAATTRRAARGRRRKRTVWDKVRSSARLVASAGRAGRAKVRAGRGRDSDVGRERDRS
jgi:hypothetical protein